MTASQKTPVRSIHAIPSGRKDREYFETLLRRPPVTLERIISFGQATPKGQWLRQDKDEWVILLSGSAMLTFWKGGKRTLKPGDYVLIPAGTPHRVERTHPRKPTVWLALHFARGEKSKGKQ